MARQARVLSSVGLYYIELKGEKLFITQSDKDKFSETATEIFSDGGKIYGMFLSDAVIRMVVRESTAGISAAMKSLTIVYARYFNKANGLTGKLFSGRFRSEPFESVAEAEAAAKSLDAKPVKSVRKSAQKPEAAKKPAAQKLAKQNPAKQNPAKQNPATPAKPIKQKSLPSWLL